MSNDFGKNITKEEQTQSLANYLPGGILFSAKNKAESFLRKLLKGFSSEVVRAQDKIVEIEEEHYIRNTTEFIEEWESAVGIPSNCFTNTVSIEQRRNQVLVKILANGAQTDQDFIDLAALLGFDIKIRYGDLSGTYPLDFQWEFQANNRSARFTMYVVFNFAQPKTVYPLDFQWEFSSEYTNVVECLFSKIKPANVKIIYLFEPQT